MASREWAEEWLVEHGYERAIPVGTLAALLDRFAADAVRAEREACARIADPWEEKPDSKRVGALIAAAIRARTESEAE